MHRFEWEGDRVTCHSTLTIAKEDRPQVKVECLRMLATLQLDPARTEFLSKFIDTYLRFEADEEQRFQAEVDTLETGEREAIMQTLTSWEEKGLVRGRQEEGVVIVLQQLEYKFGKLSPEVVARIQSLDINQIEALCKALLDFDRIDDLTSWLDHLKNF